MNPTFWVGIVSLVIAGIFLFYTVGKYGGAWSVYWIPAFVFLILGGIFSISGSVSYRNEYDRAKVECLELGYPTFEVVGEDVYCKNSLDAVRLDD